MNTGTWGFWIQLNSTNYILYHEIKIVPKITPTYLPLLNLNVLFRKWKRTYYGENISALSLKQEWPVVVKPRPLELFNVRISGLSLNQKWRSRVNKGETTSFGKIENEQTMEKY